LEWINELELVEIAKTKAFPAEARKALDNAQESPEI
jgi:hypothetical protein